MSQKLYLDNDWLIKTSLLTFQESKRKQRDLNLYTQIFPLSQLNQVANACFESCVSDFASETFTNVEKICLTNCKNNASAFYTDISHL
jgi:hypothetical protein